MKISKNIILVMCMILLYGCNSNVQNEYQTDHNYNILKEEVELLVNEIEYLRDEVETLTASNNHNIKELEKLESINTELKTTIEYNKYRLNEFDYYINDFKRASSFVQSFSKASNGYTEVYGYITDINDEENKIYIDECEFLGLDDVDRIKELGLDINSDLPSAFYIHNPADTSYTYEFDEYTRYVIYTYFDEYKEEMVEKSQFSNRIPIKYRLYLLKIHNGLVIEASEVYTP